jgi:hypothetical protein
VNRNQFGFHDEEAIVARHIKATYCMYIRKGFKVKGKRSDRLAKAIGYLSMRFEYNFLRRRLCLVKKRTNKYSYEVKRDRLRTCKSSLLRREASLTQIRAFFGI